MATRNLELRVSSSTPVKSLAASIMESLKNPSTTTRLRCIGASSVNQAVKAVIIANSSLSSQGLTALMLPYFFKVTESESTGIEFNLKIIENG